MIGWDQRHGEQKLVEYVIKLITSCYLLRVTISNPVTNVLTQDSHSRKTLKPTNQMLLSAHPITASPLGWYRLPLIVDHADHTVASKLDHKDLL